jgi:aspartate/methionine/tyrosine aminotransferase
MAFSRRTDLETRPEAEQTENALARAVAAARHGRRDGRPARWLDLTIGNPTAVGLPYEAERIRASLASADALVYEPAPFGLRSARSAVAADYAAHGITVATDHLALTSSTSEAYAVLFKMLCDPGDEVLAPVPSYPLLAWLAAFEGVELRTYPLEYAGRWHVDLRALAEAVGPRTRAIVVVNPNNPTGSYLGRAELEAMLDLGLPIVSDEVFARYPLRAGGEPDRVDSVLHARRGLVFALSGLSKLVGLPQLKLGWIACAGNDRRVTEALARLETVLDAYLSVGAPVQHALPELLRAGTTTADAIRTRVRRNLGAVRRATMAVPAMSVLEVEGGWYATLRVPATRTDEGWALALVEDGVHLQPGYFFDMHRGAHLVASLLTPEADLDEGMERIASRVAKEA